MNSKKLIKVIKTIVEAEVAKKQETFLRKTFPKILEEEVNKRLGQVQKSESPNVDPFSLARGSFRKGQRNNKTKRTSIYKKSNIK